MAVILGALLTLGPLSPASAATSQKIVPDGWPKLLTVPSLAVRAPVESIAFNRASDANAPFKWNDVAWYNRGPRPGEVGRAMVYGHLDSTCCPAAFYGLQRLRGGSAITVQYRTSQPLTFKVQWQALYLNNKLPNRFMYGATTDRGLLLITCAGVFHRDGTGYDHKRILYATLVKPPKRR